ncbi:MAG TPA: potassium/proton antiporter [Ornithinimicrobium sp.]|uniref:potassium/proton antiporter n=1 Tax=Ornithinimicrobium sp. TaxID=1977084 RepID=UPI002B486E5A|nr:potassium/proton antiporter [Ornithinimicrobium sp.]HKJ11790.1 potassium/proton antiporter [Ornithinimicrobium sp.]
MAVDNASTAMLFAGVLILLAVLAARLSERIRVPTLLLFLLVGMLAGSEGPGAVEFDSPALAQAVGSAALAVILFSGGLDTRWSSIRPVLAPGLVLASAGVLVTAGIVGTSAWVLLGSFTDFELGTQGLSWPEALLLGAIVSSTDVAALFGLFRGPTPAPRARIRSLLELESGTNDPAAIILTTTLLGLLGTSDAGALDVLVDVTRQVSLGLLFGLVLGLGGVWLANRLHLQSTGLFPLYVLSIGLVSFGVGEIAGANAFLIVYIAGIVIGNRLRRHRDLVLSTTDAFAWLAQIIMFLVLGLLVVPSHLVDIAPVAIVLTLILVVIARPAAVILCLAPFDFDRESTLYVSWAGLKGAVPIVLATFPATYGMAGASNIFSIVFTVVVVSVLAQGVSLPSVARRLRVTEDESRS